MTPPLTLEDARQRIDTLDTQLLALLAERLDLSPHIAALKPAGTPVYRPGREAALVRRLASAYRGSAPFADVLAVMRSVIGTSIRLQHPAFSVLATVDTAEAVKHHFGGAQPVRLADSATAACVRLAEGEADLAFVGDPQAAMWWVSMHQSSELATVKVLARLPLLITPAQAQAAPPIWVLGRQSPETSGEDDSLVMLADVPAEALVRGTRVLAEMVSSKREHLQLVLWPAVMGIEGTPERPPGLSRKQAAVLGVVARPVVLGRSSRPFDPSLI